MSRADPAPGMSRPSDFDGRIAGTGHLQPDGRPCPPCWRSARGCQTGGARPNDAVERLRVNPHWSAVLPFCPLGFGAENSRQRGRPRPLRRRVGAQPPPLPDLKNLQREITHPLRKEASRANGPLECPPGEHHRRRPG